MNFRFYRLQSERTPIWCIVFTFMDWHNNSFILYQLTLQGFFLTSPRLLFIIILVINLHNVPRAEFLRQCPVIAFENILRYTYISFLWLGFFFLKKIWFLPICMFMMYVAYSFRQRCFSGMLRAALLLSSYPKANDQIIYYNRKVQPGFLLSLWLDLNSNGWIYNDQCFCVYYPKCRYQMRFRVITRFPNKGSAHVEYTM